MARVFYLVYIGVGRMQLILNCIVIFVVYIIINKATVIKKLYSIYVFLDRHA